MNSCLPVSCRPDDHRGAFPNFRQPTIIGHFSLDNQRQFRNDLSGKYHDDSYLVEHENHLHKLLQRPFLEVDCRKM